MRETGSGSESGRGCVPWGLVGMLGLVLLAEGFIRRHTLDLATPLAANYRLAAQAARDEGPQCEVLCFGDSQIKFGVIPRVIEERAGRSAYNLALIGGQPPATYILLRRALEAGARPTAVLVNFKANMIAGDLRTNRRNLAELLDLRDCLALAWAYRDATFFATTALARALPSYRTRDEVRSAILTTLRNKPDDPRRVALPFVRNWVVNQGAMVGTVHPGYRGTVMPQEESIFFTTPWRRDAVNVAYLRRFLRLAEQHRIAVYWLIPPIAPDAQARREQLGLDAEFSRFVAAVQARHPNVTVIDGRHAGYEASSFVDSGHLSPSGAAAFSTAVAEVLRGGAGASARSRWIKLPPFRPITIALEDLDQSRRVVEQAKGARR
ncbi:MAG: hypothetical protein IRY99_04355 [Isosphaeraceae bacterium]|nr:hypothetical protein [Isosphaeraceae bacterium]